MVIDNNFKFRINVSLDFYEKKTDATACLSKAGADAIGKNKMAFTEKCLTISEFLQLAIKGYAFCNLFGFDPYKKYWITSGENHYQSFPVYKNGPNKGGMKISFKSDEFFIGSQVVFVDIDYTRFADIQSYMDVLELKPTAVYPSFSDKAEKNGIVSRRFRMVYVFNRVLVKDELQWISRSLHEMIERSTAEPMEDFCGTRPSQYMNGTFGCREFYQTDCIYTIWDIPQPVGNTEQEASEQQGQPSATVDFDSGLLADMSRLSYDEFMHLYSTRYRYCYRVEREYWTNDTYQLTNDDYLQLWYYREPVRDGNHRRRKLFKNACLRRLMYPSMDPDTLLFNLYVDLVRFFDNSDGVITLDVLKRKVINAFKLNREELEAYCSLDIEYWRQNRPRFIIKPGLENDTEIVRRVDCMLRHDEIAQSYDTSKSVRENMANGLSVSQSTIYRFCKSRGIDTKPGQELTYRQKRKMRKASKEEKIALFKSLFDPRRSLRDNQEMLENQGLELSLGTLSNWGKTYYEKSTVTQTSIQAFDQGRSTNPGIHTPLPNWNFDTRWNMGDWHW